MSIFMIVGNLIKIRDVIQKSKEAKKYPLSYHKKHINYLY